jgi:hypothetical protein
MEMAFGKTASGLMLAAALASAAQFTVRHEHLRKGCQGAMVVDENGVSFSGAKGHRWTWKFEDIQQLKVAPHEVRVLTYENSRLRPGAGRVYDFTGDVPAGELWEMLRGRLDQRLVGAVAEAAGRASETLPAKHLTTFGGSQGEIAFGADSIAYSTPAKGDSRTWRYRDIANISSSGPFQLTVATLEKDFNFQLKQPLDEARYNKLWMEIERKNGRIQ